MFDLKVGKRSIFRDHFLQGRSQLRYVPLVVAQVVKHLSFRFPAVHGKGLQERNVDIPHLQIFRQNDERFANRVNNVLHELFGFLEALIQLLHCKGIGFATRARAVLRVSRLAIGRRGPRAPAATLLARPRMILALRLPGGGIVRVNHHQRTRRQAKFPYTTKSGEIMSSKAGRLGSGDTPDARTRLDSSHARHGHIHDDEMRSKGAIVLKAFEAIHGLVSNASDRPISVPRIAGNPGPSKRALRRTRWQVRPAPHRSPTVRALAPASPAPQRSTRRTRLAQRPLRAAASAIATRWRRRARRTAAHERRGS